MELQVEARLPISRTRRGIVFSEIGRHRAGSHSNSINKNARLKSRQLRSRAGPAFARAENLTDRCAVHSRHGNYRPSHRSPDQASAETVRGESPHTLVLRCMLGTAASYRQSKTQSNSTIRNFIAQ